MDSTDLIGKRGLSPRVRGNRLETAVDVASDGSIPACAGEPFHPGDPRCLIWVYPRVCGGTQYWPRLVSMFSGLSPRVRGNPCRGRTSRRRLRSIPACAGEPRPLAAIGTLRAVYPRVCGGTDLWCQADGTFQGLSPRVRGNLVDSWTRLNEWRSIPACAGEPSASPPP